MRELAQALSVEMLKARRSEVLPFTVFGAALLPLVGGFFMIVLKDPELARRVGLISIKAQMLAGAADWPTYLALLAQGLAVGGIILFGFVGSWVFGREYADHTVKDLLALPMPRSKIVAAKFVLIAIWSAALVILVLLLSFGIGAIIGLAQASPEVMLHGSRGIMVAAGLTIALVTPVAFIARAGHGYLAPLGFVFLAMLLALVVAVAGDAPYETTADLPQGVKESTEYPGLTSRFFNDRGIDADVRLSYGATEAKVPDIVDCVVEITETGRALRAAGLKVIDTILLSYTEVVANPAAYEIPEKRHAMEQIMTLQQGVLEARGKVLEKLNVASADLDAVIAQLPAMKTPTVNELYGRSGYAVETVVPKNEINVLIPALKDAGATDIIELPLSKIVH